MNIGDNRLIRAAALLGAVAALGLGTGCGKSAARKSLESDANGYICSNQHKFYTPSSVFAEKCPVCSTLEVTEVLAYICEQKSAENPNASGCGRVTLGLRGGGKHGGTICDGCKHGVSVFKLPYAKELAVWGATLAKKEQVLLYPK